MDDELMTKELNRLADWLTAHGMTAEQVLDCMKYTAETSLRQHPQMDEKLRDIECDEFMGIPDAGEIIERLARESERQRIEMEQLQRENDALKAEMAAPKNNQ